MNRIRLIITLSFVSFSIAIAHADTLTGNGSFQTWNSSVLGSKSSPTTGGPYWNNLSGDGPAYNIGWCLTGAGNCQISNPPGALNYFSNGSAAASNMSFSSSGVTDVVTLLGLFSTQNGVPPTGADYFGWYSVSNGVITTHPLLSAGQSVGSTAAFLPTSVYGFYFENVQTAGLTPPATANYFWFMNDSLDYANSNGAIDPGLQHFAIFAGANSSYYLGMEDTPGANSDFDYNDMIVELQSTPEPTSFAMMLLGGISLLGLALRPRCS